MRTLLIENKEEIYAVMKACKTCYLAMSDNNMPYVLPMNFALDGDNVILHSAQTGRMWETLKKNRKVCINWTLGEEIAWQNVKMGCSYRVKSKSVLVEGSVEFVEDYDEKDRFLKVLMSQYSDLEFRFNGPAVRNVGVLKVHVENITAKEFGAKAVTPWNS
ncbi:MAG TPA: pyridoxamine 5'-phosphate oxidase family protein [Draconibacterium sp.]|nr:pyridoxamine 5'-phosphate oxidase family protein [Draconibacterium sp.]